MEVLDQVFDAFSRLKVLVVGDVMIDSYLWGKVNRISPEAPVPVVHTQKREKRLGGAANVALNLQAMGAEPVLCSVVGADDEGNTFQDLLRKQSLSCEGILKSAKRITTVKERILSGSHQMLRVDSEDDHPLEAEDRKRFINQLSELVPQTDVILFQDYDKGVLDKEVIRAVIDMAQEKEIPTVVDPKRRNFHHYHHTTLFKPNLKELREGLQLNSIQYKVDPEKLSELGNDDDYLAEMVSLVKEEFQHEAVMVTLSERGVYVESGRDSSAEKHFLPAHIRQVADVSGAGDTVISMAALCIGLALPHKFMAGLSNLAGGLVCEYLGVVPVDKKQLLEEAKSSREITDGAGGIDPHLLMKGT